MLLRPVALLLGVLLLAQAQAAIAFKSCTQCDCLLQAGSEPLLIGHCCRGGGLVYRQTLPVAARLEVRSSAVAVLNRVGAGRSPSRQHSHHAGSAIGQHC